MAKEIVWIRTKWKGKNWRKQRKEKEKSKTDWKRGKQTIWAVWHRSRKKGEIVWISITLNKDEEEEEEDKKQRWRKDQEKSSSRLPVFFRDCPSVQYCLLIKCISISSINAQFSEHWWSFFDISPMWKSRPRRRENAQELF